LALSKREAYELVLSILIKISKNLTGDQVCFFELQAHSGKNTNPDRFEPKYGLKEMILLFILRRAGYINHSDDQIQMSTGSFFLEITRSHL
jgi:hypothetical protein